MFSRPTITVPVAQLEANAEAARQSPALMATAFDRAVRGLRGDIVRDMATPKGAHIRPTAFQTPKQRRWWFAVGIHQWQARSGALEKSWKTDLKVSAIGGLFRIYSTSPSERFVQGEQAQRMHKSVWAQENEVFPIYQERARIILFETWRTVSDIYAGVPR